MAILYRDLRIFQQSNMSDLLPQINSTSYNSYFFHALGNHYSYVHNLTCGDFPITSIYNSLCIWNVTKKSLLLKALFNSTSITFHSQNSRLQPLMNGCGKKMWMNYHNIQQYGIFENLK